MLAPASPSLLCLPLCEAGTLARVIPWIIIAVVAVPILVVGFMATRRNTAASEAPADASAARTAEQEFAEAEAYEAEWHEQDKERYHKERLP
jgi:flagellar basal body-associated protein FliL